MDDLPLNLVYEILIRLPARTLGNTARHVCRSWRLMIADPYFIDHHYTRWVSQEDAKTLLFLRNTSNCRRDLVMYTADRRLEPIRPKHRLPQDVSKSRNILVCNGLVLFIYANDESGLIIYVYNPIIDLSITLPPVTMLVKGADYCTSGFGYDSIKKDYKVVLVFDNLKHDNDHKLYLYCCTIKDGIKNETKDYYCWREVGYVVDDGVCGNEGLFVGGKLYWFLCPVIHDGKILSLDLNTESLKTETFSTGGDFLNCKLLGELSGEKLCVYVSHNIEDAGSNRRTVWVKKDGRESENSDWVEVSDMRSSVRHVAGYQGYWKDDLFVYAGDNSYVVVNKRSEIVHVIDNFGGSFLSRYTPTLYMLSSTVAQQDSDGEKSGHLCQSQN